MASQPPALGTSPRQLMSLGMFVFGMDTLPYQGLQRSRSWRHALSERHGTWEASQYVGPGADNITLSGLLVPEVAGKYSAIETIAQMASAGETYPLMDGLGRIFGNYRIVRLEEDYLAIMGGGLPRHVGFRIELERGDDRAEQQGIAPQ